MREKGEIIVLDTIMFVNFSRKKSEGNIDFIGKRSKKDVALKQGS